MINAQCQVVVREELTKLGFHPLKVEMGEADIEETLSAVQRRDIRKTFLNAGLELVEDKKSILLQKIKNAIIEVVYDSGEPLVHNLSAYLSDRLDRDYTYMSNLFSERLGITIEKFYICHKIERVKELLQYEALTLTEIAYKMHYSSLAHLSGQFKKVTGLTTSQFKQKKDQVR